MRIKKIIAQSSRWWVNLPPNVPMDKRQAPWCGPLLACLKPQCHWRSECPEICFTVEHFSSLNCSTEDNPIMCNDAPLSTTATLVAVFFAFVEISLLKKSILWTKNAFHGHCGLSHLLKVPLSFPVGVPGCFKLQELSWGGQTFPTWHWSWHSSFSNYLQSSCFVVETSGDGLLFQMDFFLYFGTCCLSAELSRLAWLLDRVPLPFPFFAGSCSKEHFPPFEHKLVDAQERQSLPFLFEKSTCSVVDARGRRSPQSSISGSFSAPFSEQCRTDTVSMRCSWVLTF